jgi:hypothetical protein
MESVYHIVAIHVKETYWAHVWWLHSHYLGTGCDTTLTASSIETCRVAMSSSSLVVFDYS